MESIADLNPLEIVPLTLPKHSQAPNRRVYIDLRIYNIISELKYKCNIGTYTTPVQTEIILPVVKNKHQQKVTH